MISRLIQSRVLRLLGDLEGREGNSDFLLSDRCGGKLGYFSPWEKNTTFGMGPMGKEYQNLDTFSFKTDASIFRVRVISR